MKKILREILVSKDGGVGGGTMLERLTTFKNFLKKEANSLHHFLYQNKFQTKNLNIKANKKN